ncbi:G-rich domain on putative tyrosine kinase [Mariprofundus ferrinatatus]|uniref:G-rich domain on putative tyrosine kinase n=1 Tax=Mariprofundus ferrinatatus TaxID=1921087 RepID=A0A2K8L3V4_9PROT|nr:Wzz/FepE/Etk N-terminal domain-containing protein [Mariprofundus ferrinatatus]ATX82015.1 G-rich domain on putative tyrosine kinase [Mariprofundus ferrinatatus]
MSDKKKENANPENQPQLPPFDPRMMAAMYGMQQEDEIDLLEYWRVIWNKRKLIFSLSIAVALLAAGVSLLMPNIYRAETLLAPVSEEGANGGISSTLSGLGGLASLAGISLPSGGNVQENLAVLNSREFIWLFVKEQKLMQVLFADDWNSETGNWKDTDPEEQPTLWDAYRMFTKKGLLFVSINKDSGLITIGIAWKDPEVAASWANQLVARLNEYLRQQAIARSQENLKYLYEELTRTQVEDMRRALFELISQEQQKAMLANTQKEFAFQILDGAVAPDEKSEPKRILIVILSALIAGFLGIIFVLAQSWTAKGGEGYASE